MRPAKVHEEDERPLLHRNVMKQWIHKHTKAGNNLLVLIPQHDHDQLRRGLKEESNNTFTKEQQKWSLVQFCETPSVVGSSLNTAQLQEKFSEKT